MANRSSKNGELSWRKEAKGKKPWPNLPQHLLSYIGWHVEVMDNISIPGTIKAFRSPSRRCQSTREARMTELVDVGASDWSSQREKTKLYINIHRRGEIYWPYYRTHPEFACPGRMLSYIVGCGHGAVVARMSSPSEYSVRHFASKAWWSVPDWDVNVPFKLALIPELSLWPSKYSCCHLVFTGISHPAFAFCRVGENVWLNRDCTIIDPNDPKQQFMKFGAAITCQGKICALSMQGTVAVIEDTGSDLAITSISQSRAVPSINARYFRECLIESNGEILLVFLIFQKSMANVDQVEVYQLQIPKLRWVKIEELGDRALFVEPDSCIWVKASKVGCQSNCVFFSTTIDEWWTYDLKSATISSGWRKND